MVSFSLSFEVSHITADASHDVAVGDHISFVYKATAFPQVEREQAERVQLSRTT
jgi:hypothetical protein